MSKLIGATNIDDEEVQLSGLQCLVELAKEQYEFLVDFVDDTQSSKMIDLIREITMKLKTSQNMRVGAQCFEFWTTIIETENGRAERGLPIHNFVEQNKEMVL